MNLTVPEGGSFSRWPRGKEALKDEVGSLKSQLAEAISLLKEKAKQTS